MDLPYKVAVILDGVVISMSQIWAEGATVVGAPGTTTVDLPFESQVDIGWLYFQDPDTLAWSFRAP